MRYEYKAVGAPERVRRKLGRASRSDRAAAAFADVLNAEAEGGWEYQRTDLIPVEEARGFWGRVQTAHRAVMVFRRPLGSAEAMAGLTLAASGALRADPAPAMPRAEPTPAESVVPLRAEPEIRLQQPEKQLASA